MADYLELEASLDDRGVVEGLKRIAQAETQVAKSGIVLTDQFGRIDQALTRARSSLTATEAASRRIRTTITDSFGGSAGASASPLGAVSGLTRALGPLAGAFGITALSGVGAAYAVSRMTSEAIASASRITDLAAKTDLSTDAIQKFGFVADQTGTSIDAMASSAFKLGVRLSQGGSSVQGAISDLGLSLTQIRNLNPEAQFDAVARALSKVTSTQDRNRIGVQLFGRQYEQIAPAIREYSTLIDDATAASAENVAALDRLGDKVTSIGSRIKATWIDVVGSIVRGAEEVKNTVENIGTGAQTMRGGPLNTIFRLGTAGAASPAVTAKREVADYVKVVADAQRELDAKLTPAVERQIRAFLQLGHSVDETSLEFHLSDNAVLLLGGHLDELKKKTEEHTRAVDAAKKKQAEFGQVIRDAATARLFEQIQALRDFEGAWKTLPPLFNTAEEAVAAFWAAATPSTMEFSQRLPQFEATFEAVEKFWQSVPDGTQQTVRWSDALEETANQFARLAQISDGAMSAFVRSLGGALSIVSQLDSRVKKLSETAKITARDLLSMATSVLSFGPTIANLISEPGNKFTRMQDNRNLLASFGNLDQVKAQLLSLGDAGKHLWDQLMAPNHRVHETQRFFDLINSEFEKIARLQDIIREATFDRDQAGRSGIDAVLASLEHQRDAELRALQQLSGIDAALYAQAVQAVTQKYTALADRAIRDEADRMAQSVTSQVDELARVSTLLDTIKKHTDTEIASLGQFSSAGAFYQAVVDRIRNRQSQSELSALRQAGNIVAPAGNGAATLNANVTIESFVAGLDENDPQAASRLGRMLMDKIRQQGHRVN